MHTLTETQSERVTKNFGPRNNCNSEFHVHNFDGFEVKSFNTDVLDIFYNHDEVIAIGGNYEGTFHILVVDSKENCRAFWRRFQDTVKSRLIAFCME